MTREQIIELIDSELNNNVPDYSVEPEKVANILKKINDKINLPDWIVRTERSEDAPSTTGNNTLFIDFTNEVGSFTYANGYGIAFRYLGAFHKPAPTLEIPDRRVVTKKKWRTLIHSINPESGFDSSVHQTHENVEMYRMFWKPEGGNLKLKFTFIGINSNGVIEIENSNNGHKRRISTQTYSTRRYGIDQEYNMFIKLRFKVSLVHFDFGGINNTLYNVKEVACLAKGSITKKKNDFFRLDIR